jgi:hypothetical protein
MPSSTYFTPVIKTRTYSAWITSTAFEPYYLPHTDPDLYGLDQITTGPVTIHRRASKTPTTSALTPLSS